MDLEFTFQSNEIDNELDKYVGMNKIQYDILSNYISKDNITKSTNVFISIGLEVILERILSCDKSKLWNVDRNHYTIHLLQSLLSLAHHYMRFVNTRLGKHCIVIFYMNTIISDCKYQKSIVENYRKKYELNYIGAFDVIPYVQSVTEHIPAVLKELSDNSSSFQFIIADSYESSLIPYILQKQFPMDVHVNITNEIFETVYMFHKNITSIYKYNSKGSRIITNIVSLHDIVDTRNIFSIKFIYYLFLSLIGNSRRNIKPKYMAGNQKILIEKIIECFSDVDIAILKKINCKEALYQLREICFSIDERTKGFAKHILSDKAISDIDLYDFDKIYSLNTEYLEINFKTNTKVVDSILNGIRENLRNVCIDIPSEIFY